MLFDNLHDVVPVSPAPQRASRSSTKRQRKGKGRAVTAASSCSSSSSSDGESHDRSSDTIQQPTRRRRLARSRAQNQNLKQAVEAAASVVGGALQPPSTPADATEERTSARALSPPSATQLERRKRQLRALERIKGLPRRDEAAAARQRASFVLPSW